MRHPMVPRVFNLRDVPERIDQQKDLLLGLPEQAKSKRERTKKSPSNKGEKDLQRVINHSHVVSVKFRHRKEKPVWK